eukprot:1052950-Amphidinium_carterae.1
MRKHVGQVRTREPLDWISASLDLCSAHPQQQRLEARGEGRVSEGGPQDGVSRVLSRGDQGTRPAAEASRTSRVTTVHERFATYQGKVAVKLRSTSSPRPCFP